MCSEKTVLSGIERPNGVYNGTNGYESNMPPQRNKTQKKSQSPDPPCPDKKNKNIQNETKNEKKINEMKKEG